MSGNRAEGEPEGRAPSRQRKPGDRAGVPSGMRLAGVGMELAASTLVLGGIGLWIDRSRGRETPYLAIAGALVGFAVGLYRLIRLAVSASEESGGGAVRRQDAAWPQDASSGERASAHTADGSLRGGADDSDERPQ